ncbi:MAG: aldo/keto reductase [Rhodobacteraceae bacterium]|nr:aldo/keto reductase [Paracoccaceae bacterium]
MGIATRRWERPGSAGLSFTEIGLGTAPLGNLYRAISDAEAEAAMEAAWDEGLRYFDTAPLYGLGLAETRLNRFLRGRPRDAFLLSTKIGRLLRAAPPDRRDGIGKWFDVPSRTGVFDYSRDGAMRSLEASLERLGVDRIDIVFAHDLDIFTHGSAAARDARLAEFMEGAHGALVELRAAGVIGAFGLGVNEWQACQWVAERGDPDLFLLAGRYTLLEQGALDSFLPLCLARGLGVVIGGPFNSGILATGARPGAHYDYEPAPPAVMARVARIEALCRAHDVAMATAALRFPLLHPAVVSVIPGGQAAAEVRANARAAAAPVPAALWAALRAEGLIRADAPVHSP